MAIAALTRRASFVIYKDEPESHAPGTDHKAPSSSRRVNVRVVVSPVGDKENLHPLTGRRPSTGDKQGKKMKTNVLATKLLAATGKTLPEPLSPKKRKLASPVEGPAVKKDKRDKQVVSSKSKGKQTRCARKATELPRLEDVAEEEGELECPERLSLVKITQAAVDARCYELTVLPLADLSQAYEQVPFAETHSKREGNPKTIVCPSHDI